MADLPKVTFVELAAPVEKTVVVFAEEGKGLLPAGRGLDERSGGMLSRALEAAEFKGKKKKVVEVLAPHGITADRVLVVGLGDTGLSAKDWLDLGGIVRGKAGGKSAMGAILEALGDDGDRKAAAFAQGFVLRSYDFKKYKTNHGKKSEDDSASSNGSDEFAGGQPNLTVYTASPAAAHAQFTAMEAACRGVFLARDLVNEPANILTPSEFAARLKGFASEGLGVEVLDEARMRELGMGALLAVGQGSAEPSFAVILRWMGGASGAAPAVLIGKGVCFDTGGISIKPAQGMEEMKGDMAGAAAVAGAMLTLARRKAKANVIGVIGLVENMPSGTAQRPGDIVTSASGQTIEVLNTDAEGRLVLADLIWYAHKHLNPKALVTLATLTGAIIVALGKEYAGLFSNDDTLAQNLASAGEDVGEGAWRLPLGGKYDKQLDSKIADMNNIGGRDAGSITAAQFLQRFVEKGTPWAHLDVAGTAMASPATDINQSWGSGYGVRLLDRFVARYHEG